MYGLGGCDFPSLKDQLCVLIPMFSLTKLHSHENNLKPVTMAKRYTTTVQRN